MFCIPLDKDGDKYYYRRDGSDDYQANNVGLEFGIGVAATVKNISI